MTKCGTALEKIDTWHGDTIAIDVDGDRQ